MSENQSSEGPPPERWSMGQICEFYGAKKTFYYEIRKLGKDSGTDVPWEDPEKLVEWFELMKMKGLRKHGPPPEVAEKAEEAALSQLPQLESRGPVQPVVPVTPRPAEDSPPDPTPADQPTDRRIEMDLLQEVANLTEEVKRLRASGMEQHAALAEKRLRLYREELRKWKTSMPKMKDAARELEQKQMMGRVAAALGRALLRGMTRELPEHKAAITRAWNAVAESLPALLNEELGIVTAEKAA